MRYLGIILIVIGIVTYSMGGVSAALGPKSNDRTVATEMADMVYHHAEEGQASLDPCCHQSHCNAFVIAESQTLQPADELTVALSEPFDAYSHRVTPPLKHPPKA